VQGLAQANRDVVAFVQQRQPEELATLDVDATLVETSKQETLKSYKGFKAYQPPNVYWAEQELLLCTEFSDGNVPAGHEKLRVFQEALEMLPEGVKTVRLRSARRATSITCWVIVSRARIRVLAGWNLRWAVT